MNNSKYTLLAILEAIKYEGDKEAFAAEFLRNVHLQSLLDLVATLPSDKQAEIKNQLSANSNDPEKLSKALLS